MATGILEDSTESIRFLHQQFVEYFAGLGLSSCLATCVEDRALESTLSIDLEFRERDPVTVNALSVIASAPSGTPLLDRVFRLLVQIDVTDACYLLSQTASPNVVGYLVPIPGNDRSDPLVRLCSIQALANIPHELAVKTLNQVVTEYHKFEDPIVRAAIVALGKSPMRMAKSVLEPFTDATKYPAWLAITALHAIADPQRTPHATQFSRQMAVDNSLSEHDRTTAVEILGEFGDDNDARFLQTLLEETSPSFAMYCNAQSAMAKIRSRIRNAANPQPTQCAASLCEESEYEVLWALESTAKAATKVSGIVDAILPDIFGNLPPSQLEHFVDSLMNQTSEHKSQDFVDRIVRLCTQNPSVWELIRSHDLVRSLSPSLLQSCARVAGRRWIPWQPEIKGGIERAPNSREPDEQLPSRPSQSIDAEAVMIAYLKSCLESGRSPTLIGAVGYSEATGNPWSKSTLHTTKAWKFEMQQRASRRSARGDRSNSRIRDDQHDE